MPSLDHEALVELIRGRPELTLELLRHAAGIETPDYDTLDVREGGLTEVTPVDYQADLVVLLRRAGGDESARLAIVVEVQLRRDEAKRYTWPYYAAAIRAQWRCPACVVVVTPEAPLARWARTPIEVGPGWTFTPIAVGPEEVPQITDLDRARALPELAVLSAIAHARSDRAAEIGYCASRAAWSSTLDADRAGFYHDLVLASVDAPAKQALEELMDLRHYQYKSDFARHYVTKGRQEGRHETLVHLLLSAIEARDLELGDEQRRRIETCSDPEQLERWHRRALTARSVDEVLDED